ncbi:hypothetical protein AAFC00_006842 [Neodothiora populina]|uniref:N-acetyltransferase domain-containing protein n=1 Tax=Neodothiora populina TaxID=2781224 RepID=A0ABR3PBS0_9PEZI
MVPRLRARIGIETLRKELDAAHASQASTTAAKHHRRASTTPSSPSTSSTSSIATFGDIPWTPNGYLSVPSDNPEPLTTQKHYNAATVGDIIPGYRTSAAFLSSLRTNLRLLASPPPSPMTTPPSMRASAASLNGVPEPSPLGNDTTELTPPQTPKDPLDGVPDLGTYITEDEDEKIKALKLVADSIAQMRQTASRVLIFHPLNIAIFTAFLAVVLNYLYKDRSDIGIVFTTGAGLTMASLIAVRWLTGGYLFAAEEYAESKNVIEILDNADVLVTKFGDEIIGAVILGWRGVEAGKSSSPRDSQRGKRRKYRAEIRGWAVRIRYRGKGVGSDLLEEAVHLAKSRGADSIAFAGDHANSKRVLWDFYNAAFDRKERTGMEKLQGLWNTNPKGRKR